MSKCVVKKVVALVASVIVGGVSSFTVSAADQQQKSEEWEFKAGLGAFAAQQPWKDSRTLISPFPLLSISHGSWTFLGEGMVNYTLWNDGPFSLSIGVNYRDDGYGAERFSKASSSDNIVFDGYKKPKGETTFEVKANWQNWFAQVHQDISGNSGGMSTKLGLELPLYSYKDSLNFSANVFVNWQDKNYVQHLYGINADQIDAAKGRTAYAPAAALNLGLGLSASYAVNSRWNMMLGAEYMKFDDTISNSPLVGRNSVSKVFALAIYSF